MLQMEREINGKIEWENYKQSLPLTIKIYLKLSQFNHSIQFSYKGNTDLKLLYFKQASKLP